jgi:hypothetical protein
MVTFKRLLVGLVLTIAFLTTVAGCTSAASEATPTADLTGLTQNMQGMMAGMQGMMTDLQGTPMSPETMSQMQGMMAGMQGMMGQMQAMPGMANMPENMAEMQAMMGTMQGMMNQMHAAGTPMPMQGMMMGNAPVVPAGIAYSEGLEIRFIHTEVSDADIAQLLTDMMSSPVLVVPSLADVPETALAPVYVFTNGVEGMGPLGYQPDVFPYPPGTEGYTPLRTIHLVTWVDAAGGRPLTSTAEVEAALAAGELTEEIPGVVVNMPFITWPDGER